MKKYIILFDGVCNLCNSLLQFVIKRDKKQVFRYAPLQSDIAKKHLAQCGLPESQLDTMVLVKNNTCYTKSSAALEIIKEFSFFWKLLLILKLVPRPVRDLVYNFIARNRYKWFGKKNQCMLSTPELRKLFIN